MDELSDHDVVLTGGEPTLYAQFLPVLQLMCRRGKTVTVTSNGTSNDWLTQDMGTIHNLFFQISVDGDEPAHDAIRGYGTFSRTIDTLRRLDSYGLNHSVVSVVSRKNIDSMPRLSKVLSDLSHLRFWKVSYEMPFGSSGFTDMMTVAEWNNMADALIASVPFRLRIKKLFPFELYDKRGSELSLAGRCLNCGSGCDKLYIYPDFNVYPCTCLTDFCLGNLRRSSLREIFWRARKSNPFPSTRFGLTARVSPVPTCHTAMADVLVCPITIMAFLERETFGAPD